MTAIYLSGLIFFILQAIIHHQFTGPRIWGALLWPIGMLSVPVIVARLWGKGRIDTIVWGSQCKRIMWGVGA